MYVTLWGRQYAQVRPYERLRYRERKQKARGTLYLNILELYV